MGLKINKKDLIEQTLPEFFEPAEGYQNINKKLLLEIFLPPDEKLKKDAFVLLGLWSYPLNFNCYTEVYFSDMIFESCQAENIQMIDTEKYAKLKNHLIKLEIEAVLERLSELKGIFKRYSFPAHLKVIRGFLDKGELELENETFLNILREEELGLNVLEPLIKNRLTEIGKMNLFYILAVIYMDLYKIHQFLISELDHSVSDSETSSSTSESERTATQWALYHYVLQKAKIKPWFTEKKKGFIQLEKEYGRHWNNLQTRWNLINNSEGQEGYSKKDLLVVEAILKENHPEAISKLKEISDRLF